MESRAYGYMVISLLFLYGAYVVFEIAAAFFLRGELAREGPVPGAIRGAGYWLALVVFPTIMLCLSMVAFNSNWKGEKGLGWFGVIHEGYAGATILPIWLICQISLSRALVNSRYMLQSKVNFVMVGTLAAICLWYTYSTLTLKLAPFELLGRLLFCLAPGLPCLNLILLLLVILKRGQLAGRLGNVFGILWWTGLLGTLLAKYYAARALYDSLPDTPPSCFVATAAARGHRRFVGGWRDPLDLHPETEQLRRLRAFEACLRSNAPRFHRRLRSVYNVVGPMLAARIRSPWAADVAYVLLKPLEIAAACYCRLAAGRR